MSERPASAAMLNVWTRETMQRVHARHPENGDAGRRDRAAYVTAARDVLEHHAPALLRPGVTEWVGVVATLAQYLAAKSRPLPTKLLRELGVGVIAEELVRDWMDPAEAARLTKEVFDAFVEAIRPRVTWRIAQKPEAYVERLRVFAQRRAIADDDFLAPVLERFHREAVEGKARFLAHVPLPRLRTYPDAMIGTVIHNFVLWDPMIQFLERGRDDAEEKLASILSVTVRAMRSRGVDHGRAEDSVHEALRFCQETLYDPWQGYVYESPFHAWIVATATNLARGHARHLHVPIEEDYPALEVRDDAEKLRAWEERRLFVLATFDKSDDDGDDAMLRRACAIIDALIASADVEDKELAETISRTTGVPCSVNAVRLTRMTLRARLGVFKYLDSRSERTMVEWCKARWGMREHDVAMMQKIEASGRAASDEDTLAWALIAWAQFESDRFLARWEPVARDMMKKPWPEYETRHAGWLASDRARSARSIRNRAASRGRGWAVPSAWHLRILRLQTPAQIEVALRSPEAGAVAAEF